MPWKINVTVFLTPYKGKTKLTTFREKEAFLVEQLSKDYIFCVLGSMLPVIYFIPIL